MERNSPGVYRGVTNRMIKPLEQHVSELRAVSETLVEHSFPRVSADEDSEVDLLRNRQILVDGYDVHVTFGISDYDRYRVESVQIRGVHTPFLPFSLVCKIARYFLGDQSLSYIDVVQDNRKVYCWSVRRKRNGKVLPVKKRAKPNSYEGLTYHMLDLG